jgi:hypothetical protein
VVWKTIRTWAALALVATVSGCVGSPQPTSSPSLPAPSPSPTRAPTPSPFPTPRPDADLVGRLGGDAQLEEGCSWLRDEEGEIWEVVWPEGYEIEFEYGLPNLHRPGELVALAGDVIGVNGAVPVGPGSLCLVGMPFQATEIVFVDPPAPPVEGALPESELLPDLHFALDSIDLVMTDIRRLQLGHPDFHGWEPVDDHTIALLHHPPADSDPRPRGWPTWRASR